MAWMETKRLRITVGKAKIRVGQHVRISKEKMKFANAVE
jgi:hypothetical protein